MKITHGSLFSGRGGFDLAAESCEIDNVWNCEIDKWLRAKLKRISPNAKQYENVKTCSFPESVTIMSAGFPCQDISISNWKNKQGIKGSRSGLWTEVKRITNESKPLYLLLENSSNIRRQGLEYVLQDLYEIGYNAEWDCLRAIDFGFPHQRERMYIIAYSNSIGQRSSIFKPPGTFELSRSWTPTETFLSVSSSRKNRFRDIRAIQRGNVVHNHGREIHAFGNAIMPVIAEHLFRCVLEDYKQVV